MRYPHISCSSWDSAYANAPVMMYPEYVRDVVRTIECLFSHVPPGSVMLWFVGDGGANSLIVHRASHLLSHYCTPHSSVDGSARHLQTRNIVLDILAARSRNPDGSIGSQIEWRIQPEVIRELHERQVQPITTSPAFNRRIARLRLLIRYAPVRCRLS